MVLVGLFKLFTCIKIYVELTSQQIGEMQKTRETISLSACGHDLVTVYLLDYSKQITQPS